MVVLTRDLGCRLPGSSAAATLLYLSETILWIGTPSASSFFLNTTPVN